MTMTLVQETATPAAFPQKLFYRIHEVAEIAGVKPHVLRYWETQFKQLAPEKDRSDQRRYRPADVTMVLKIRDLLYGEKFTIAGARKQIESERAARRKTPRQAAPAPAAAPATAAPLGAAAVAVHGPAGHAGRGRTGLVGNAYPPPAHPAFAVRAGSSPEAAHRGRLGELAKIRAELCDLMQCLRA